MANQIEVINWGHAWRPVEQGEKVDPDHVLKTQGGMRLVPARLYLKPILPETPTNSNQAGGDKLPSGLDVPISNL